MAAGKHSKGGGLLHVLFLNNKVYLTLLAL